MKSKQKKWKIGYKDKSGVDLITDENDSFVCSVNLLGEEYPIRSSDELEIRQKDNLLLISKSPELKSLLQKIVDSDQIDYMTNTRYIDFGLIEDAEKLLKLFEI